MAGPAVEPPKDALRTPPPLPRRLVALAPIVYVGTGIWLLASVVLALTPRAPVIWLWTAVSGVALGLVGMGIMWWQRRAAARGARGAQRIA